jgi:transposase
MLTVENWAEIRRLHTVEKLSRRAIAKRLAIHRNTVTQALSSQLPPRYTRPPRPSPLDPYKLKIRALLDVYPDLSGVRMRELLDAEGYSGQQTILNSYLRDVRGSRRRLPIYERMDYIPGEYAQIDWAVMPDLVPYDGELRRVYAFLMVLCYSRLLYVEFTLSCRAEDFTRAHRRGLEFFQGTPRRCVYDNLRTVVIRRRGTDITFNPAFLAFAGTYHFEPHACWPAQPHQKGVVERPAGYVKRNFWAGRAFRDFREIEPARLEWLRRANARIHGTTHRRPIDLWAEERDRLLALPPVPYDTDVVLSLRPQRWGHRVRFDTNDYTIPAACLHDGTWVTLRATDSQVRFFHGDTLVATHPRCWGRHRQIVDPAHAVGLRSLRPASHFAQLEAAFLSRYGEIGRTFYAGLGAKTERLGQHLQTILRLETTTTVEQITQALAQATLAGTFDAGAVAYALYRQLAPTRMPMIPVTPVFDVEVPTRDLQTYDALAAAES